MVATAERLSLAVHRCAWNANALEFLQDIETIQAILKHLPETSGRVIRMKFLDDLSYEEIADELRVSVKKARSLMRRAKKQLLVIIPTLVRADIAIRNH